MIVAVNSDGMPLFHNSPGGSVNAFNKTVYAKIIEKMTEKGYIYFDWNASLEDAAKNTTPEALVQNAVSSTLGRQKECLS